MSRFGLNALRPTQLLSRSRKNNDARQLQTLQNTHCPPDLLPGIMHARDLIAARNSLYSSLRPWAATAHTAWSNSIWGRTWFSTMLNNFADAHRSRAEHRAQRLVAPWVPGIAGNTPTFAAAAGPVGFYQCE